VIDRNVIGHSATRYLAAVAIVLFTLATPFGITMTWAEGELREALSNMTYPSEWTRNGRAPLVGGIYEEPAAPGSASKTVVRLTDFVATGRIGDQAVAALVIVTDPAGSGVFFDLYLLRQQENRWDLVDRAQLGDRIRVNKVEAERGLIGLDLTVHGPRDGTCCPTEHSRVHFALQGERLVKASEPEQKPSSPIEGQVWAWQHSVRGDGTRSTPTEPDHYTLRLGPDGQLDVRADCNRAGGGYRVKVSSLTLSVTHSTMAACPPESLDREFLADLASVNAWCLEENSLHVNLTGGGTMVFTAAGR
jgi:heat shock protein HslJ